MLRRLLLALFVVRCVPCTQVVRALQWYSARERYLPRHLHKHHVSLRVLCRERKYPMCVRVCVCGCVCVL